MDKFLILLLAVSAVHCYNCTGKPDGVYEPACKYFIVCINEQNTNVECFNQMVYNEQTDPALAACVDASTVDPPCGLMRNCVNIPDGRYADVTTNCTSYFTCFGHNYFGHNYCSAGLEFNEELQICDWPNPSRSCSSHFPHPVPIG